MKILKNTKNQILSTTGKALRDNAPTWVKDGFNEMVKMGSTPEDAIKRLSMSPFFSKDWLLN